MKMWEGFKVPRVTKELMDWESVESLDLFFYHLNLVM